MRRGDEKEIKKEVQCPGIAKRIVPFSASRLMSWDTKYPAL